MDKTQFQAQLHAVRPAPPSQPDPQVAQTGAAQGLTFALPPGHAKALLYQTRNQHEFPN